MPNLVSLDLIIAMICAFTRIERQAHGNGAIDSSSGPDQEYIHSMEPATLTYAIFFFAIFND